MVDHQRKSGFTLIESIISIVIIGIIAGLVGPFIIQFADGWSFSVLKARSSDHHRNTLMLFTNDVEQATSVVSMSSTQLTVLVGGSNVSYAVVSSGGGVFQLERTQGGVTSIIAQDVIASGVLFQFFNIGHETIAVLAEVRTIMITLKTISEGITIISGTSAEVSATGTLSTSRM